jgi:serine/threonine protein phosphatase PrpC
VSPALVGDIDGKRVNPVEAPGSPRKVSLGPMLSNADVARDEKLDLAHAEQDQAQTLENEHVAVTKKGYVPYNVGKTNQDSYFVRSKLFGEDRFSLYGVCDGHGEFGHHVSAFVKDKLPSVLEELGKDALLENPEKVLTKAVDITCNKLARTRINTTFSGTTCVFALRIGSELYCANIGDSRCVIGTQVGDSMEAKNLSRDHKPDLPEERERILSKGGRVHALQSAPGEDAGPMRVWLKDVDVPGLAMSRSIGDQVSHTVGVTYEPVSLLFARLLIILKEIMKHEIGKDDMFVIWATDGIWEFISSQEAVDIVRKSLPDIELSATSLVLEGERRWKQVS